jgi:hypothetical protein
MANIPIWTGFSNFSQNLTPFGYYDLDPSFASDADRVARYVAFGLGFPTVDLELQPSQIYSMFEDATNSYAACIYDYKIRDNYSSFEGSKIGTVDVNNQVPRQSLQNLIRLSQAYGTEAGVGGKVNYYSGSLDIKASQSVYDLKQWANASASLSTGDSIEIRKIFHQNKPASIRFYDPLGGTGLGVTNLLDSFGFGEYSPAINYMLLPLSLDLLRIQTLELNDQIRRSQYSFELINNVLRISPIPIQDTELWFHYTKESESQSSFNPVSGSVYNVQSGSNAIVTNPSQVPYAPIVYSDINMQGRQWIREYTLASCKIMLGNIRGKYSDGIDSANAKLQLNAQDLFTQGQQAKTELLTQLREMLEATSKKTQIENQAMIAESTKNIFNNIPIPMYIG